MKDTEPVATPVARYRILVTTVAAAILGIVGFILGWSSPTEHPDDRLVDILIPTLVLAVIGALLGYVVSSVFHRRMSTIDAFVCFAIPVFTFIGFIFGKSGDLFRYRVLSYGALAMIAYLGLRVCISQLSKQKPESHDPAQGRDIG